MSAFARALSTLRPDLLAGPIFHKELRVSSRRRRNYVLRSVYLLLLLLFIAGTWSTATNFGQLVGASAIQQMAGVGKAVTTTVVWFQFVALQLVALVLCSTSICDEVQRRTLGVLLTTPITSTQIVVGKMLSRMLQLFILLALSLPVLAVVRVFGGVPWDFVLSALAITTTSMLFTGSVSMFFSVYARHSFNVVVAVMLFALVFNVLMPIVVGLLLPTATTAFLLTLLNPAGVLMAESMVALNPSAGGLFAAPTWPLHCLVMLGISVAVLAWCSARVRRVALRQMVGETLNPRPISLMAIPAGGSPSGEAVARLSALPGGAASASQPVQHFTPVAEIAPHRLGRDDGICRPVTGSPIVWKELRAPLFRNVRKIVGLCIFAGMMLLFYSVVGCFGGLTFSYTHGALVCVLLAMGLLETAAGAGAAITSEKEANTWPILLTTPLTAWQIVGGKLVGAIRRAMPLWLFLLVHVALFTLVGIIHIVAAIMVVVIAAVAALFVASVGLYSSARLRKTGGAVAISLLTPLLLWVVLPGCGPCGCIGSPVEWLPWLSANPFVQAFQAIVFTSDESIFGLFLLGARSQQPDMWQMRSGLVLQLAIFAVVYVLVAGLLLLGACRAVRRKIL